MASFNTARTRCRPTNGRMRALPLSLLALFLPLLLLLLPLLPPAQLLGPLTWVSGQPSLVPLVPAAPSNCSAAAGTCVRIGHFSCPWGGSLCSSIVGYDRMIEWYRERIATKLGGRLAGVPVRWVRAIISGFFAATTEEVYDTVDRLFIGGAARDGTGPPLVDFVVLPFGSLWDTAMQLMERHRIPSVASAPDSKLFQCGPTPDVWNLTQPGCKGPNTRRYKYAHGVSNPGEQYFQPWVGLLKLHKAQSIAMIRTAVPFYETVRAGMITAAADNSIPIVYDELVLLNTSKTPAVLEPATVRRVVAEVEALQPDGFLLITQDCVPWIEEMERRDYAPKSLAAVLCSDGSGPLAALGDRLRYVVGSSQWSPEQRGLDSQEDIELQPWSLFPYGDGGLASPLQFEQFFQQIMNSSSIVPGYAEATVLPSFSMLEGAITLAGTVDPESVQAQLLTYYQPSFYGLLTTNRFGVNDQKRLIINQRDASNALHIISPSSMSTGDFIYPMPRFSERVYRAEIMESTIERVLLGLIALCATLTGTLALLLYWDRRRQRWHTAGLPLYLLTALGCICACASIPTWPVENDATSCASRVWTWTLSFHLFVDPVLAVAYRMVRAVTAKLYRPDSVSTRRMAAVCIALVAPQLLLNALWSALAPLRAEVVTTDPLRPAFTSFTTCSGGGSGGTVFLVLTLSYCGALLLLLYLLVYRVRRTRGRHSDARAIATAVSLFVMTATVVLVVQATLSHRDVYSERVLFGLRSVGLLVAYQGSVVLLFLPRVAKLLPRLTAGCDKKVANNLRGRCAVAQESPEPALPVAVAQVAAAPSPLPAVSPSRAASVHAPTPSPAPVAALGSSPPAAPAPLDSHHAYRADPGDAERTAVASSRLVADLVDAQTPLPPRAQLLALPLEETVAVVMHFQAIVQQLRAEGTGGGGNGMAGAAGSASGAHAPHHSAGTSVHSGTHATADSAAAAAADAASSSFIPAGLVYSVVADDSIGDVILAVPHSPSPIPAATAAGVALASPSVAPP